MTSKPNPLPASLVSNLQNVLLSRKQNQQQEEEDVVVGGDDGDSGEKKPVVLVTNGDGIDGDGLVALVQGLIKSGEVDVCVCVPHSDRSCSGHSVTPGETLTVSSAEVSGASAFEVTGTPVDCVSLALSGALFSWTKPTLVISGINRGLNCGQTVFHSGVIAAAREALICGVPAISISLNWKKDESQVSDFKDAVDVCLPLIHAAIRDIKEDIFPKYCALNIDIPTSPLTNKGFRVTRQSLWRSKPSWQAVSANRHPSGGNFMSNQQSLGIQLAQLSRDASAAGAARRINTHKKNVEVESVGIVMKANSERVKKFFRLEFLENELEDVDGDEDLDLKALVNGYISVTPMSVSPYTGLDAQTSTSKWIAAAFPEND